MTSQIVADRRPPPSYEIAISQSSPFFVYTQLEARIVQVEKMLDRDEQDFFLNIICIRCYLLMFTFAVFICMLFIFF